MAFKDRNQKKYVKTCQFVKYKTICLRDTKPAWDPSLVTAERACMNTRAGCLIQSKYCKIHRVVFIAHVSHELGEGSSCGRICGTEGRAAQHSTLWEFTGNHKMGYLVHGHASNYVCHLTKHSTVAKLWSQGLGCGTSQLSCQLESPLCRVLGVSPRCSTGWPAPC